MPDTAERWADIPDLPGYQASTEGRIRSPRGRVLSGTNVKGYLSVHVMLDGRRVHRSVHRLVLGAHVGPCPDRHETRHINGNGTDNRLSNIKWGTHAENNQDRVRHGTHHQTAKTHCPRNHEYTPENTYHRPDHPGRQCRTCNAERERNRKR